jgi:hypothetical protein
VDSRKLVCVDRIAHITPETVLRNSLDITHTYMSLVTSKGGRTRTNKISVGAGVDILVANSTTQVWCTHTHRQNRYRRYKTTSVHMEDECVPALHQPIRHIYRGGRWHHHADMSVVVPITLSCRPRVLCGHKVT